MDGAYDHLEIRDVIHVAESQRNSELSSTIAQMYTATVPVLIQVMRDAVVAGDLRELFRAADALMLSSTSLGALRLAGLCRKVCDLPYKRQLADVTPQLDEIAQVAAKVCDILRKNQNIVSALEFA